MADTPVSDATRRRHAALIDATLRAIDALPPLSPDATLKGFEALKARHLPQDPA